MHRDTVTILRPIVVPLTPRHHLMTQGSVHNSWKLNIFQFSHGLHTHQTCHPLSMFGMLWIDMYDSMFQFPPQYPATLHTSGTTFNRLQSTAWSTLCEGDVIVLHEANSGHTRYGQVFWSTPLLKKKKISVTTDAYCICIPSHVTYIMHLFQLTDFLIWTVTLINLWHLKCIFWFSVVCFLCECCQYTFVGGFKGVLPSL
jgi:hypothetical protein